jgi:hypothetical protein
MVGLIDAGSIEVTYAAGDWIALCGPQIWLLVSKRCPDDIVERLETALPHGLSIDAALEALISHGLTKTASFAMVGLASQDRRVVVRGSATVQLMGAQCRTIQTPGPVTWQDVLLSDDVAEALLGSSEPADGVEWNEVRPGRVGARALRIAVAKPAAEAELSTDATPPDEAEQQAAEVNAPDIFWGETVLGSALPQLTDAEADTIVAATAQAQSASAECAPAPPNRTLLVANDRQDPEPDPVDATVIALPPVGELIESVPWATPGRPTPTAQASSVDPNPTVPVVPFAPPVTISSHRPPVQPIPGQGPPGQPPPVGELPVPPPTSRPAPAPPVRPVVAAISSEAMVETVNRGSGLAPLLAGGPTVLAAQCPAGHVTSVVAARCRICGQPVPQQDGFQIIRPALGVLRLSTGDVVTLDRGVVFGRAPETHAVPSADRPNVMRLHSPHNDLSRTHAEVILDEWNVYVCDLDSTNGTTVTLPGQAPTRLRPRDRFLLESGAIINLADEVNILFEVTS